MSNREIELMELVDGAYDIIELAKSESPAQVEWRKNWLAKARRLVPQNSCQRKANVAMDIQGIVIQGVVATGGVICAQCSGNSWQVIPPACDGVIKIECHSCFRRVEFPVLMNKIIEMMGR
jgi:hypothetical protein